MAFPAKDRYQIIGDVDDSDGHRFNCYLVSQPNNLCMAIRTGRYTPGDGTNDFKIIPLSTSPITCLIQVLDTNLWLCEAAGSSEITFQNSDSQPTDSQFQFEMTVVGTEGNQTLYSIKSAADAANEVTIVGPMQDNGYPVQGKAAGKGRTQKWKFVTVVVND